MTGTERGGADPATLPPGQMTETEFRSLYEQLRRHLLLPGRGSSPWTVKGPGLTPRAAPADAPG
jgi:hypothetical protein